jgi:FMN-dependent oxidoreductase (nitrilotriacetate monooxygenase family)
MAKKMHFGWFSAAGHGGDANSWQRTTPGYDWRHPELYRDIALTCERAKFDLVFFADNLAMPQVYQGSWDYYLKVGMWTPLHDPVPVMGLLAGLTRRVGLVCTLSTSFYPPFMAARVLSSLDHLSRGRVGWNVVTSVQKVAAQNFGQDDLADHDLRYDIADEYVDLCRKLWDSWEPDALVLDRSSGLFGDASKIHAVDFDGEHFKCRGPLTVPSSPQGRPLIISAGSSPRGMRYAAQHAEVTVIAKTTIADMKKFTERFRDMLVEVGRSRDACKVFAIFRPIIGETETIAREKWEEQMSRTSLETGLATLSEQLGYDMSKFDPDEPLPSDLSVNAIRSRFKDYYENANPTLREVASKVARNEGFPICGTPEQIADVLEQASLEGGVDGFLIRLAVEDILGLTEFVDRVIPVLQVRGLARNEYAGELLRDHIQEF